MENTKTDSYYKEMGFMCGLEIHQRLATREKLFCSCTSSLPLPGERKPAEIRRYQRAVAGEMGLVDRAAKFESVKNRQFIYQINEEHACLVDLDEEPPHRLNPEALELALSVAAGMELQVPDELEPMRKQVVDGSNPSAFQRTIKMGSGGSIEVRGHRVEITSMSLEEESAGIEGNSDGAILYDTSRIGIPLIEIDTDPHIRSPTEAKEAALKIGTMLRLTGKVQRGIGSIRQDVNISIKGGARTEIKGLQALDTLDKYVENEITRQQRLLEIKAELAKRKGASVGRPQDLTELLKATKVKIIFNAVSAGGVVIGFPLHGFKGLVGMEINPDRRLGSEISDYAKMGGVNGIIHSDEDLNGYGFTKAEADAISKVLALKEGDAFVLIAGRKSQAATAVEFAIERSNFAITGGVPLETRGAANNDLCTTRFLRPLPGGSRMYPETDASPVAITQQMLKEAAKNAPDIERERKTLMSELKSDALVEQVMLSPRFPVYKAVSSSTNADKIFIANTLLQKFTELRRAEFNVDGIATERVVELFAAYAGAEITKNGLEEVLKAMCTEGRPVREIIRERGLGRFTGKELEKLVGEESRKIGGKAAKADILKAIMSRHRLNVDGEELNRMLNKAGS